MEYVFDGVIWKFNWLQYISDYQLNNYILPSRLFRPNGNYKGKYNSLPFVHVFPFFGCVYIL